MQFRSFSRKMVAPLIAAALWLTLAPMAFAAAPGAEIVALRIQGDKAKVLIEMPVELLQFIAKNSKKEHLDVGKIGGKDTQFPMADLMKIVESGKAKDHEVLFFTAKDEHGESGSFYVKTFTRKGYGGAGKPTGLMFTVVKDGKEKVSITVSMDTVDSWAKDFGGDDKGSDDFGPFIRTALACAKELGAGPLLRIETEDSTLVFSLK